MTQIQPMSNAVDEYDRIVCRTISNLDDIYYAIETLAKLRSNQVDMEMELIRAEVRRFFGLMGGQK